MSTITKKKVIDQIARKTEMHPDEIRSIVQNFLDNINDHLSQGDRFEFRDFGVFEIVEQKQKIGRNPKKPEIAIVIPQKKRVKFTPGKKIKALIESSKVNTIEE